MDRLLTLNWGGTLGRVSDIIRDPGANPIAALLLLASATIFVLILLVFGVMLIINTTEEDEDWEEEEGSESAVSATETTEPERPSIILPAIVNAAILLAVGLVIWLIAGIVTAGPSLCLSCHADNPHARAQVTDPHATVGCVACHEPGGMFGSVTFMVVPRGIHFVSGIMSTKVTDGYSRTVASSSCLRCHARGISKTITIEPQGVRVSHAEPLAAGAQCSDCHALERGVVSNKTVGMTPCLRCHDGKKVPSTCETCHTKDIGAAASPSAESTIGPQILVPTPDCYVCHGPAKCDACHGIRLPHTKEFMLHGHARVAAINFWFGGGKTCFKCHNAGRRPCQRCHGQMPSHGTGPFWAKDHQYGSPTGCSQGCHGGKAGPDRPMCEFCHKRGIKPLPQPAAPSTASPGAP